MAAEQEEGPVCGVCGTRMVWRLVAPCLECGGDPRELMDAHEFARVGLFDGEVLCDFCDVDMPSSDPSYWGFPEDMDWDKAMAEHSYRPIRLGSLLLVELAGLSVGRETREARRPPNREEWVCPKYGCFTLLRTQRFVIRNARRNGVVLPRRYWPFLRGA